MTAFAEEKPEAANATKAEKRVLESAPAESKALWQQHQEALTHINLADDTQRQVIIARGSPGPGAYHAHPTTALLADNKTMFCVRNIGHGDHAGPVARSDDGGLTWTRGTQIGLYQRCTAGRVKSTRRLTRTKHAPQR